jgi:NAD(P)-dependent dehydrogenase (short-subunit alcohol dehydrogenase family)
MLRWAADVLTDDPETAVRAWGRRHPLGRVAEPREIAQVALFLAGPRASFVTGAAFVADGGLLSALGPFSTEA